jgi:hypothetical protein
MFKKIVLIFIALLVIYLVLPDVSLSPDAEQWMTKEKNPIADEDNLFNALAGLAVAPDENMAASGIRHVHAANRKLEEFLEAEGHLKAGEQPEFDDYWTDPALVPTEGVLILCDPRAQDCRDIWISQKEIIQQLVTENETLLNRYRELHNYQYYRNTLAIDVRSPIPGFSTLLTLNRLFGADIVIHFVNGETAAALTDLKNDIAFLRRLISQTDTLIIKMVALSMLKHDLYLYASLIDIHPDEIYLLDEIPGLTEQEKSIEEPIKYEFLMNANLANEIKSYPQLITGDLGVPAWLPFPLYRVNHSINMIYHGFNKNLEKSRLPANEFYEQFSGEDEKQELKPGWLSYVYNPIGCILFTLSLPDLSKYIIRIHDMDGLISMINLKLHIKRENINPADTGNYVKQVKEKYYNPYTGDQFDWNPGEQSLSFQGPGSDFVANKLNIVFKEPPKE